MVETRKYLDASEVAVGDVVQAFNGAFGSCIVTRIEAVDNYPEPLVHLARPMARVDAQGSVWTHHESFSAYMGQLLSGYEVFVTGASGRKDNRGEE